MAESPTFSRLRDNGQVLEASDEDIRGRDPARSPQDNRPAPASRRVPPRSSWVVWGGLGLVLVAILGGALLLRGSGGENTVLAANVREILENPDTYVGQQVFVSGRVEDVLTHRALNLGSDLSAGSLLALVKQSAMVNGYDSGIGLGGVGPMMQGALYQKQDVVQFFGTIEKFDRASLADELGIVLNEGLFGNREGEPVLLVERLDVTAFGGFFPSPVPLDAASPGAVETPTSEPTN